MGVREADEHPNGGDTTVLGAITLADQLRAEARQAVAALDVTLMTSDLSRLVEVLALSKRCRRVILFNFWGTVLVDALGMGLAFFGLLAPIAAALIHVGSELAFILNSARLFGSRAPLGHPK